MSDNRSERVVVLLTPAELARLDLDRGLVPRGAWLRQHGLRATDSSDDVPGPSVARYDLGRVQVRPDPKGKRG